MARQFTRAEVAQHEARTDAWLVINNGVYDVTEWLNDHPGGAEVLLANAGRDASQCFHDVGHSDDARDWMKRFRIGDVPEAERWEVPSTDRGATGAGAAEATSLGALLSAASPPLAMAVLAYVLFVYLF